MNMSKFLVFALFEFLHFLGGPFFWHILGISGDLGDLRELVSYEVTRGITLVVGTVMMIFRGVCGGLGGLGFCPNLHPPIYCYPSQTLLSCY